MRLNADKPGSLSDLFFSLAVPLSAQPGLYTFEEFEFTRYRNYRTSSATHLLYEATLAKNRLTW